MIHVVYEDTNENFLAKDEFCDVATAVLIAADKLKEFRSEGQFAIIFEEKTPIINLTYRDGYCHGRVLGVF